MVQIDAFKKLFAPCGEAPRVLQDFNKSVAEIKKALQKQRTAETEANVAVRDLFSAQPVEQRRISKLAAEDSPLNTGTCDAVSTPTGKGVERTRRLSDGVAESLGFAIHEEALEESREENAALSVDRRLWGSLPESFFPFTSGIRSALARFKRNATLTLRLHPLQIAVPPPCQLLNLPSVEASSRFIPVPAVRPPLGPKSVYAFCCLNEVERSPCLKLDAEFTLRTPSNPQAHGAAATLGGEGGIAGSGLWMENNNPSVESKAFNAHTAEAFRASGTAVAAAGQEKASAQTAGAVERGSIAAPHSQFYFSESRLGLSNSATAALPRDSRSLHVCVSALRVSLLRRARIFDSEREGTASEAVESLSAKVVQTSAALVRSEGLAEASHRPADEEVILEALLKGLEFSFTPESDALLADPVIHPPALHRKSALPPVVASAKSFAPQQQQTFSHFSHFSPPASPVVSMRVEMRLANCGVRLSRGQFLLRNTSALQRLFRRGLGGGPASASSPGAGAGHSLFRSAVAAASPRVLEDPTLQVSLSISHGQLFVSAEAAPLRVEFHIEPLLEAFLWSEALQTNLGEGRVVRLGFPGLDFGCAFSTASWPSSCGVEVTQLLQAADVQEERRRRAATATVGGVRGRDAEGGATSSSGSAEESFVAQEHALPPPQRKMSLLLSSSPAFFSASAASPLFGGGEVLAIWKRAAEQSAELEAQLEMRESAEYLKALLREGRCLAVLCLLFPALPRPFAGLRSPTEYPWLRLPEVASLPSPAKTLREAHAATAAAAAFSDKVPTTTREGVEGRRASGEPLLNSEFGFSARDWGSAEGAPRGNKRQVREILHRKGGLACAALAARGGGV